jgi:hypothetical protein
VRESRAERERDAAVEVGIARAPHESRQLRLGSLVRARKTLAKRIRMQYDIRADRSELGEVVEE